MDTLPLRSASSTLLYDLADMVRNSVPHRASTSTLCFEVGTGLAQTVRRARGLRLSSARPMLHRHRARVLPRLWSWLVSNLSAWRTTNNLSTTGRQGDQSELLITLDDLEDTSSSVLRRPSFHCRHHRYWSRRIATTEASSPFIEFVEFIEQFLCRFCGTEGCWTLVPRNIGILHLVCIAQRPPSSSTAGCPPSALERG